MAHVDLNFIKKYVNSFQFLIEILDKIIQNFEIKNKYLQKK